ncbi:PTS lactose/cellobiose transporter subunit IIA [uncultured Clostridium sp.]|uniref:PTS lactose/cellobiose transporter subunit IIA n=1 Tax=uncultured Clostridium sp. TaxID=59620 RepID=UPI0028EF0CFB|nr:PTS lactose/cellobiose transporter subunit IIA [uncultured Clostridium sp.]
MEEIIMNLIVNGGDARSNAMNAIEHAKAGEIEKARELIVEANEALDRAHDYQTKLIQEEAEGNKTEVSILMVHAQDHLMNAMTITDIANEFIQMYEVFENIKNNVTHIINKEQPN